MTKEQAAYIIGLGLGLLFGALITMLILKGLGVI